VNQLEAGRELLRRQGSIRRVIACDRDVDGLSAGVLIARTLERLGAPAPPILTVRKGEHVQHPAMTARLRDAAPDALIVLDMGSRGLPILPGVPTLLVDHHQPHGFPPGAIVVSGFG
jgi:single-stranded-DNA-specific exonuclease